MGGQRVRKTQKKESAWNAWRQSTSSLRRWGVEEENGLLPKVTSVEEALRLFRDESGLARRSIETANTRWNLFAEFINKSARHEKTALTSDDIMDFAIFLADGEYAGAKDYVSTTIARLRAGRFVKDTPLEVDALARVQRRTKYLFANFEVSKAIPYMFSRFSQLPARDKVIATFWAYTGFRLSGFTAIEPGSFDISTSAWSKVTCLKSKANPNPDGPEWRMVPTWIAVKAREHFPITAAELQALILDPLSVTSRSFRRALAL